MLFQCDKCKGVSWNAIGMRSTIKYLCVSTLGNSIDCGRPKAVCADCGNESPYFRIFDADYVVDERINSKSAKK